MHVVTFLTDLENGRREYRHHQPIPEKALNPIKWSKRIYQWADLELESHISYWIKSRVQTPHDLRGLKESASAVGIFEHIQGKYKNW